MYIYQLANTVNIYLKGNNYKLWQFSYHPFSLRIFELRNYVYRNHNPQVCGLFLQFSTVIVMIIC